MSTATVLAFFFLFLAGMCGLAALAFGCDPGRHPRCPALFFFL